MPHDRQVVRDEQEGDVEFLLQVLHQVDHLCLDGHVECRHRLVGNENLGLKGQRPGDADALALTAREFVRIAVVVLGAEPHYLEQFLHACEPLVLRHQVVDIERRTDDRADRLTRVQRGVRVLEDHLDVAADRLELARTGVGDIHTLEEDLTARRLVQPGDQPTGGGLAAAGLTDEAEGLPGLEREGDAIHRLDLAQGLRDHTAGLDGEVHDQVTHVEKRSGHQRTAASIVLASTLSASTLSAYITDTSSRWQRLR